MPRYYFDTFDGQNWIWDALGLYCEDVSAVRKAAHAALTDLIRDEIAPRAVTSRSRSASWR